MFDDFIEIIFAILIIGLIIVGASESVHGIEYKEVITIEKVNYND